MTAMAEIKKSKSNLSLETQNPKMNGKFTVTVRVRPLTAAEKIQSETPTVTLFDENVLIFDPSQARACRYRKGLKDHHKRTKEIRYAFDKVFGCDSFQRQVFENTTQSLIDGILDGFNATVFAYGATGAGKTHTMAGTPSDPGIMVLTMCQLFDKINELKDEKIIDIKMTYLEIYNETIRDLLVDNATPLDLREDSSKKIVISGLSEHEPKDVHQVMELLRRGNANRMMSPTEANATSSRSHAVLQIHVQQKERTANISSDIQYAILSLIDLAGSERASVTKNKGARIREGANINRSLLALGNCINALCASKKPQHIPYRDSKLTRLLKYSLGGNCRTVMIAAVSPYLGHYEDTYNTLVYANRAKNIKTNIERNTLNVNYHIRQYVQIISELRIEIEELKARLAKRSPTPDENLIGNADFNTPTNSLMKSEKILKEMIANAEEISKEAQLFESHQAMLTEDILFHETQLENLRFIADYIENGDISQLKVKIGSEEISTYELVSKLESSFSILQENLEILQFDLSILFEEIDRHESLLMELRQNSKTKELSAEHLKHFEQYISMQTITIAKTRHESFTHILQKSLENQRQTSSNLMYLCLDKSKLREFIENQFANEKMLESLDKKIEERLSIVEQRFSNDGRASVAEKRLNLGSGKSRNFSRMSIHSAKSYRPQSAAQANAAAEAEPNTPRSMQKKASTFSFDSNDALSEWKNADPRELVKLASPSFKSIPRSLNSSPTPRAFSKLAQRTNSMPFHAPLAQEIDKYRTSLKVKEEKVDDDLFSAKENIAVFSSPAAKIEDNPFIDSPENKPISTKKSPAQVEKLKEKATKLMDSSAKKFTATFPISESIDPRNRRFSSIPVASKVIKQDAKSISSPEENKRSRRQTLGGTSLPLYNRLENLKEKVVPSKKAASALPKEKTGSLLTRKTVKQGDNDTKDIPKWKKLFISSVRSPPKKIDVKKIEKSKAALLERLSDDEDVEGLRIAISDKQSIDKF